MVVLVTNATPYEYELPVKVNDWCNHDGAEFEELEFAKPRFDNDSHGFLMDDSEFINVLYCHGCKSYEDFDGTWVADL